MISDGSPRPKYFVVSYLDYYETTTKLYKVWKGTSRTHKMFLIDYLMKNKKKCAILYLEDISEDVGYDDSKYEFEEIKE